MGDAFVGAIALLVLVYLFWTLLRPEKL